MIPEIELYPSGEFFNPLKPNPAKIHIADIAHALSMKCRFTGHCRRFISVAEHSLVVSKLVPQDSALAALLHDATEAYLPDIASPVKQQATYSRHKVKEKLLEATIFFKFNIFEIDTIAIKLADNVAVGVEALYNLTGFDTAQHWEWVRDIHDANPELVAKAVGLYRHLRPEDAEAAFLHRWQELTA